MTHGASLLTGLSFVVRVGDDLLPWWQVFSRAPSVLGKRVREVNAQGGGESPGRLPGFYIYSRRSEL